MNTTTTNDAITEWPELTRWFKGHDNTDQAQLSVESVRDAIDQKTKPPGSLGELELIAAQLALVQNTLTPEVDPARVIVFGGDHGITQEGVSAYPAEVTPQMMANFAHGGAAVCTLSAANSIGVEVVDVGVNADLSSINSIVHGKIAQGTKNFSVEAAMTEDQCELAMAAGRAAIDRAEKSGVRCVGLGEMGIGNTSSASALLALSLQLSATDVTGRGTGVDDATLDRKAAIIERAIELHAPNCTDSLSILRCVGGFEIAAMTGAMLRASERSIPVLIDGFISTTAAVIAVSHNASVRRCLFFSHRSSEAGHQYALTALNARPILSLGMRLGEGSATALAHPLLRAASAMLTNMATFADAGVSTQE